MAQADFDFSGIGTGAFVGGADGTARLHASLSNPLAGEGSYCREYANSSVQDRAVSATINASVNGGEFFEMDESKSISVRAWLRATNVGATDYAIGLGVKVEAGAPPTDTSGPHCYGVVIGDNDQTNPNSDFVKFYADAGGAIFTETTGFAVTDDTWTKVRMDVIPVGTAEDHIKIYSGTGATGSEVWTLEYEKTSDPYYIPWGDTGNGKVGFFASATSLSQIIHIDRFQVFTEDV